MLRDTCKTLEHQLPLTSRQIFEEFDLLDGHPWAQMASDPLTTYYACLYGIVSPEQPRRILEIGTAFGMGTATLLKASRNIELLVSLDLGIFGTQLGMVGSNIEFARGRILSWCQHHDFPSERVRFYQVNTQPFGKGDNDDLGQEITRWDREPELVRLLQAHEFDAIFVDGKHTEDGLLNDLESFWPFLKSGGLIICDDIHDPAEYDRIFPWVPDTWQSVHTFIEKRCAEIEEHCVWNFPRVPPAGKNGLRPFGLIHKTSSKLPITISPGFEMFDSEDALLINRARQDHLASLGLDLARQSVLEVGAGVGWHTAFFEKLGCMVLSTDARPRNVEEHVVRYPHRKGRVEVADLTVPGSHDHLGEFDIVYCYGTLYHLGDPAMCIRDLSKICRKLFLLETCVNHDDNAGINLVLEDNRNPNQSLYGVGCRPGRDWVIAELRKHFPFVYITATQPDHPDFPLTWPAVPSPGVQNTRAVFVASRLALDLPTVSPVLLAQQQRLLPINSMQ